jgi:type II secretory pathway component PulF
MTYPILQLTLAWFLGSFALRLVRRLGAGVNLWEYFVDYARFQAVAMGVFLAIAVTFVLLMRSGTLRKPWGYFLTYAWPLNKVTQRFARARFFRSLALLIGSGVPIQTAVERAATTMLNPIMERDFLSAVGRIRQGYTLAESFAPCKFMTPQTMEMMYVGEESGKQEEALLKASQYQQEEAAQAVSIAARVGEVLLILAVAIVVGYVVITFYSNLYGGMLDDLGL